MVTDTAALMRELKNSKAKAIEVFTCAGAGKVNCFQQETPEWSMDATHHKKVMELPVLFHVKGQAPFVQAAQ